MKTILIGSLCLLAGVVCLGQIGGPRTPSYPVVQPAQGFGPGGGTGRPPSYPNSSGVRMGGTAEDIQRQQQQYNSHQYSSAAQRKQEVDEVLRELERDRMKEAMRKGGASNRHLPDSGRTRDFPAVLKYLQDMLAGKVPLSVADAYFAVEKAYGDCYLTKAEYDRALNESVNFIRTWMEENGLDAKDNYMVQFAIRKFLSTSLTITKTIYSKDKGSRIGTSTHGPFGYDFRDYQGLEDHRNMFVTKCLATGYGQCASLPIVYLILAERLRVKAYLSLAPQHSFVKYPDNSGYILNYEPTSHWEMSDNWYKDNMLISAKAVSSGLYLDTLSPRQVVANCMIDLAIQYIKLDRTGKEDFILDCLKAAAGEFPKNNHVTAIQIKSMHLQTMLREAMRRNGIDSLADADKVPEVKEWYDKYRENENYLKGLGYEDLPAGLYEQLMMEHEFKGKMQENMKINTKLKRNLFIDTQP